MSYILVVLFSRNPSFANTTFYEVLFILFLTRLFDKSVPKAIYKYGVGCQAENVQVLVQSYTGCLDQKLYYSYSTRLNINYTAHKYKKANNSEHLLAG